VTRTNLPARIPTGDRLAGELLKAAVRYVNDPRAPLSRSDRGFANVALLGLGVLVLFSD
jgi:hypothetical protein